MTTTSCSGMTRVIHRSTSVSGVDRLLKNVPLSKAPQPPRTAQRNVNARQDNAPHPGSTQHRSNDQRGPTVNTQRSGNVPHPSQARSDDRGQRHHTECHYNDNDYVPRRFSCIVIACIYHPPDADNMLMRDYLITCVDTVLRKHPESGFILTGDFDRLRDQFLSTHYAFKQLVKDATRGNAILYELWSSMNLEAPTIVCCACHPQIVLIWTLINSSTSR